MKNKEEGQKRETRKRKKRGIGERMNKRRIKRATRMRMRRKVLIRND